jgi:ectoine hydroxylase-related dioxygenase (phytanoyl-CoA dioxygenase family)
MGPLAFAPGSQKLDLGRDLEISDASQSNIEKKLLAAGLGQVDEPFELGEVSFHAGWTFHRAGKNTSSTPREVMTVIYMDADMRLAAPRNENQQNDWDTWCPGAKVGERIDTPLNPVLWEKR